MIADIIWSYDQKYNDKCKCKQWNEAQVPMLFVQLSEQVASQHADHKLVDVDRREEKYQIYIFAHGHLSGKKEQMNGLGDDINDGGDQCKSQQMLFLQVQQDWENEVECHFDRQ